MPRYRRQYDRFRCGPVAIYNALKWAGAKVDFDIISDYVHCNRKDGTFPRDLNRGLRDFGQGLFKVKEVRRPTIEQMADHLHKGGALVYRYYWRWDVGHYFLIDKISSGGKILRLINPYDKDTIWNRRRSKFIKKHMKRGKLRKHNIVWFLEKT